MAEQIPEMVERVKAAIWQTREHPEIDAPITATIDRTLDRLARAAIAALREPTTAMVKAGIAGPVTHQAPGHPLKAAWRAMVDAALEHQ